MVPPGDRSDRSLVFSLATFTRLKVVYCGVIKQLLIEVNLVKYPLKSWISIKTE